MANPSVYAQPGTGGLAINAESDENGIYAFDNLVAARTYTIYVSAEGYTFPTRNITTGTSRDNSAVSGNVWGVDFYGTCREQIAGDVNHDCVVDMADYAALTAAYLSQSGGPRWNADCDISSPADDIVDMRDLNVFFSSWLTGGQ